MTLTKSTGELVTADDWNALVAYVQSSAPTGSVSPYAGSAAPSGWLLCDGSAVSRTTYADLFAVLGTTYGIGDGGSTFNLPDLRGRFPLGLDNMGGTSANRVTATQADNLGESSGSETQVLTTAQLPAHTHQLEHPAASDLLYRTGGAVSRWNINPASAVTGTNTPYTTISTGSGDAHNNMPPYMSLNYIIKS